MQRLERAALARCAQGIRPHKKIYNRFIRWSRLGVFSRIFTELAAKGGKPDQQRADSRQS
jgi:hypothetical protein